MSTNSDQWVVRLKNEQVKGPYSTSAINQMIINGVFSGSEEICSYPEGEWKLLTKQPEFYNALLESLENPAEVDSKRAEKMEAPTLIRPSESVDSKDNQVSKIATHQGANEQRRFGEQKHELIDSSGQPFQRPIVANKLRASDQITEEQNKNLEIQMTDLKKLKLQELKKLLPWVAGVIFLLIAAMYLFWPDSENVRSGWSLIGPQKSDQKISEEAAKNLKRNAVKALQNGLLEQILIIQKDLVQVVEGAPRDLEAMGLLCVVYEQLWPYTKQTQQDLKSITRVTQMARSINPISKYSDTCQVIYLMTKGQNKEARSLLENTLDNATEEKFSLSTFLYLIKAEMLENEGHYLHASAYYDQASKLWPNWITAKFGLARAYYKQSKFAESREQYEAIYKINNRSKAALFGLALIEVKSTKNIKKSLDYFSNGFVIKESLPRDFLTEALYNYAQILTDQNEKKRALEVAEEGYLLNPGHRGLKEMVILLGGNDKINNAQAEIILVGDQFAHVGDHMAAQAQYKTAFEVDPTQAVAAYKAAKSLWKINQSRDAVIWLEKSIKADPKMLQAYTLKADYESQKFNFSEASKTLQKATRLFAKNHEVIKTQALLEFRKNNMIGAIQYGERAMKIYNADVELLSLLAQAHIYYYLHTPSTGKDIQKKKEESKTMAERYAGRVIELEPAWPEGQITFSKILAGTYGPVKAELYLKGKIKEYPYTSEYRIALAEFYMENEKYSDAVSIYEELVTIEPKSKKANFGLAEAYRILSKPEQAQRYYNLTSVLDPSDVEPMIANAKLLLETSYGNEVKAKTEQALAKLLLVKKINPDYPKVSFLIAKCYLELNDYQKALEMANQEKLQNPNIVDSYILIAEIFSRKGQFKECAEQYSIAINLRPSTAELYVRAAACYRNSDVLEIAEDMLAIALQKESGYPLIYREQGYIYEKKNNRTRAILSFEKYLTLSPNAVDREVIESKIKELGG